MLYPKFTQRYLAAIVCCLIVVLGISTLFFVYSFYLRRSPLLVENLQSMTPNLYVGKLKKDRLFNIEFQSHIDNGSTTRRNVINIEHEDANISNIISNRTSTSQLNQSNIPFWESKKKYSDINERTFSDTIYFDDYERNKTISKVTFESETVNIGKDKFDPISYSPDCNETLADNRIFKLERVASRENANEKSFSGKVTTHQHESNLDAVYDRSEDSNESLDIVEDDEDLDDFITYGSGSGNYGLVTYAEEDPLLEYNNPTVITDFSKDWVKHDEKMLFNSQIRRRNHQTRNKQIEDSKPSLIRNKGNKSNYKSKTKGPKNINFSIEADHSILSSILATKTVTQLPSNDKRQFASRMKSRVKASAVPYQSIEPLESTRKAKTRLNQNPSNKTKKARNEELIITTSKQQSGVAIELSDRKLLKSAIQYIERDNDIFANDGDRLQSSDSPKYPQMNPTTWVETRARRILGNVRRSEERSRQLLLCEEAGGGELCRMLFKGHSSE